MKYLKKFESNSTTEFEDYIEDLLADIKSEYPLKIKSENGIIECEISIQNQGMDQIYYFGDKDSEASKNLLKQGRIYQKIAGIINLCDCGFRIKTHQNQFYYTFYLKFFKPDVLSNLILEFKNHYNKKDNSFIFKDGHKKSILNFQLLKNNDVVLNLSSFFEETNNDEFIDDVKKIRNLKNLNKDNYDDFVNLLHRLINHYYSDSKHPHPNY